MVETKENATNFAHSKIRLKDGTEMFDPPLVLSSEDPEILRAEIHKYIDETLDVTLRDQK